MIETIKHVWPVTYISFWVRGLVCGKSWTFQIIFLIHRFTTQGTTYCCGPLAKRAKMKVQQLARVRNFLWKHFSFVGHSESSDCEIQGKTTNMSALGLILISIIPQEGRPCRTSTTASGEKQGKKSPLWTLGCFIIDCFTCHLLMVLSLFYISYITYSIYLLTDSNTFME